MDKFTSKHLIFIMMGAGIVSLKTYPTVYMRNGGRESWVAIIVSSLLILAFMWFVSRVYESRPSYNIYELFCTALGKPLGTLSLIIYTAALFMTLVESAAVEAHSMHTNMLLETPAWYFALFFIVPAIYTINRDKVALVTITLIGITLICIAGINLAILTAKYKKISFLLPIFAEGIKPGFWIAVIKSLALYGSVSVIFPYFSDLGEKSKLVKHMIIGIIIIIQMEVIAATGVIMTFDIERLNTMAYPKLLQTQLVSYFRFFEGGELYVMLQILGGWYLKYVLTFYAILSVLKSVKKYKLYMVYVISALALICSILASNNLFVLFKLLNYYCYVSLVAFIVIPLVVFGMVAVKTKPGRAVSESESG